MTILYSFVCKMLITGGYHETSKISIIVGCGIHSFYYRRGAAANRRRVENGRFFRRENRKRKTAHYERYRRRRFVVFRRRTENFHCLCLLEK